ncbi:MAG TPA: gliding motility-associated C-terminal domain-containing protein, partial [Bacteroidia bacterium]|nr:gliding motility-associated C-terminal domain-containing protein [Bacteroidia bacterium]
GIYIGEMWRLEYNACLGKIIIGGGGTRSLMGILDTSLTNCDTVNIIGTLNCCHDVCLMTLDNYSNNCYFALAKAGFGNTDTSYNNYLIKCPASTLTPATFILPDGYSFLEYGIPYVPTNAMNGMAASPDWLYLYDGAVLKRFDKNTGALKSSKSISSTSQYWGGLDVDLCNNIYLANNKTIEILDSNENNTGSILAPDTVYDLLLASSNLLAGGNGFIASYPVTAPSIGLSIAKTPASSCNTCDGIAKAIVKSCSTDTSLFSYNWSDGQTNRIATGLCFGNYTVTVSVGCDIKYSDTVNISALPTGGIVLTTLQKNESCYGDSNASITVNATGGTTPYTYIWMPGGSTSATLSSLTTGTYSVVVKDSAGCADAIISVTQPLPILIDKSSITSISCYGGKDGCINVNANGGASPYTYVWLSTSSDSSFACNLSTGTYSVSVTDANGCNKIDSFFIPQPPQIMVSTVSPVSIYTGQTTTISASASGGTAPYAYVWQAFFNGSSISVSPADTTVYEVTATDANGCQGTAYVTVDVLPSCEIFVPDAFSPNGDGQNDVLYVRGSQCIQSLDFVIYDRWGNKIFETQNLSDGWDGKYLGQPMNTGTYAYYLRAYTLLNTLVSQEGNITLIR